MKGAPEYMRIFRFMHGVNNPELKKRLNEHVPKTMEEMMTVTTSFIRGETLTASKKESHTLWKPRDQPKRHVSERRYYFRGQPWEGRGSNRGVYPSRILSRCLDTDHGTPVMSNGCHANISKISLRMEHSSSYFEIFMTDFGLFEDLLGRCGHSDALDWHQDSATDSDYSSVNRELKHSVSCGWYRLDFSYSRSSNDTVVW
nr:reverse transcriptase domain-containing protein [Tanacetum cinerariifolium]